MSRTLNPAHIVRASLFSFNLRAKVAIAVFIGFAAIFLTLFAIELKDSERLLQAHARETGELTLAPLAQQLATPLKFQDSARIADIYAGLVDEDIAIDQLLVRHFEGDYLSEFKRSQTPSHDLRDDLEQLISTAFDTGRLQDRFTEAQEESRWIIASPESYFMGAAPIFGKDGETVLGVVAIGWNHTQSFQARTGERLTAMGIGALVALIGLIAILFFISWAVTRPLQRVAQAMAEVAAHEFTITVPGTHRGDEIGLIARSLEAFRLTLEQEHIARKAAQHEQERRAELFDALAQALNALSNGDLGTQISVSSFADLGTEYQEVCETFNDVVQNLSTMMTRIVETAETVRNNAAEISDVAFDQSKRSEAQAATLEESAAAIEELNVSVQNAASSAAKARDEIKNNTSKAIAGGEIVNQTIAAMEKISASSEQISAIIGVIDDIAFQTNLLALNAGVEAARAGDAGRGFAVVASEVRALAQRASESANEIKTLILSSGELVSDGSALVSRAGNALEGIIEGVSFVANLISDIADRSEEQANHLTEIKDGVTELDQVTQQNAAVIEETSAASRSLSEEADRMTDALSVFRLDGQKVQSLAHDTRHGWESSGKTRTNPTPVLSRAQATSTRGTYALSIDDEEDWHEF